MPTSDGTRFAVWSGAARQIWLCVFDDAGKRETDRIELKPSGEGVFSTAVTGMGAGTRYGFRADGEYAPDRGLWFDPQKLLVDPYAWTIDRPFVYDPELAARRGKGADTASLIPKAIVAAAFEPVVQSPPHFDPAGLIYELPVKAFSIHHPDVPANQRGTLAALANPTVIDHLTRLNVSAVELMPIAAWIDERHLQPLGLSNCWGYNPVTFMALDPRLAPGGLAELRTAVTALHAAGIGVILDVVFNHTGESDALGPTLSLRGLDARAYYRHAKGQPARLINDTGTGNTVDCANPIVQELVLDTLRYFVVYAGIDGFRFDLAPILGRNKTGFDPNAPLLMAMRDDPILADRVLIAEPWDIGPDGYRLGSFGGGFLEWNDKYRDDVRRFWRGDRGTVGNLATRLAGSSDVFDRNGQPATRSVNFIAAHDGMTLADLLRYERKHNELNGEQNRDGHSENLSWNGGVEGESRDAKVILQRQGDVRALLSTLFASRGPIMITAGDEFGRTQKGNNNAYAQDNDITWLDWDGRDIELEAFVAALAALRKSSPALAATNFLTGQAAGGSDIADVAWLGETGARLSDTQWQDRERNRLAMLLADGVAGGGRLAVLINGDRRASTFSLPERAGYGWWALLPAVKWATIGSVLVPGRTVVFAAEYATSTGEAG